MMEFKQRKFFGIDLKDRRIEEKIEKEEMEKEEILVFGSTDGVYAFDGRRVKKIDERNGKVRALAVWNEELYYAWGMGVYRIGSEEAIAERQHTVGTLVVWRGELYDGGGFQVCKTMDDLVVKKHKWYIVDLVVWGGDLYMAEVHYDLKSGVVYSLLRRIGDGKIIAKRIGVIRDLCVWNRELYDATSEYELVNHDPKFVRCYGMVRRTIDEEVVARRSGVSALCVYKEKLCDAGEDGVIRWTISDEVIHKFKKPIYCMISVKRSVLRGLI